MDRRTFAQAPLALLAAPPLLLVVEEPKRYVWRTEADFWSAETLEEALRLRDECYGYTPEQSANDPFNETPYKGTLRISFPDGDPEDSARPYPRWADEEPEATVEMRTYRRSDTTWALVSAPAEVWARRDKGLIASQDV
jgi:hypothetical protein